MSAPEVVYSEGPPRRYTVDGEKVPSVTQVLGVLDKPALPWWGMTIGVEGICRLLREGFDVPIEDPVEATKLLTVEKLTVNHVRDTAATRGKSVHDALQEWVDHQRVPKLSGFPEEDRGFVRALASFLLEHQPECIASEVVVGSAVHRFAGRYDLKCALGGVVGILDVKTGKRIYDPVHLQLAAYAEADFECGTDDHPVEVTWALRLGADGTFELMEGRGTGEQFLAVLGAYNALQELKASKPSKRWRVPA